MLVKLLFFGEAVDIPSTSIGLGLGLCTLWIDGNGFTSASNDLGALGYIFLETPEVDVGHPDADVSSSFLNLHGQVVSFEIKPNLFVKSGGIAHVVLKRSVQQDGVLLERRIELQTSDCRGVSVTSNPLTFSAEMVQLARPVASLDQVVSDDDVVAIADAVPTDNTTANA